MAHLDPRSLEECFEALYRFVGILDPSGNVLKMNQAARNMMGSSQIEAGIPVWKLTTPFFNRRTRHDLKKAVLLASEGKAVRCQCAWAPLKENSRVLDLSIRPVFDDQERVHFLLVEGQDITETQKSSAALIQSEAIFKTIYEEAGIGIVIKAENGRMVDCNPAFQAMVGYSSAELRQRDYLDITHTSDAAQSRRLFHELITEKRQNYFIEKRYIHKNGQTVWGRMAASLVKGQNGEEKYVIGIVENITANKQIEAELNELQRRLMQGKDNERLRLAQDLHDGPLQEIIGVSYQVQELENSLFKEDAREQLHSIRSSLQQLMWSIRSICGELRPPTLAPFGLEKTILSHIERFHTLHPEIQVKSKLAHDGLSLPENVRIAFFRIYQESMNNIVRHAHAKSVKINFRLTPKSAVLEIQDDGVGFELPDHWVKLARQGHLGLVGAVERAKEIGGDLDVVTGINQGTKIKVSVPLKADLMTSPAVLEEMKI